MDEDDKKILLGDLLEVKEEYDEFLQIAELKLYENETDYLISLIKKDLEVRYSG